MSHSLKLGWVVSGVRAAHSLSRDGIQLTAKWQFCSTTHPPCMAAACINFSACSKKQSLSGVKAAAFQAMAPSSQPTGSPAALRIRLVQRLPVSTSLPAAENIQLLRGQGGTQPFTSQHPADC